MAVIISILHRLNNPFKLSKVLIWFRVIQFTRYIPFAAANFDILTQSFPFVKHFFQSFSNFFFISVFFARALKRFDIISDDSPFVKHFFHFSANYFPALQVVGVAYRKPLYVCRRYRSSVNIAQYNHF